MYIQDLDRLVYDDFYKQSTEAFLRITTLIASGDVQYVHPYAMKEFLIKYAGYVLTKMESISRSDKYGQGLCTPQHLVNPTTCSDENPIATCLGHTTNDGCSHT